VTAVAAVAAAVVAGSSFPHLQFVPCEFNIKLFVQLTPVLRHQFPDSGIMAPKETKRDRERRLLKAQEQEATDAATDGPTDDNVASPEVAIEYDAGGVVRPGTSSAAAAASTASGASAAAAVAKVGSLSMTSDSESDGIAREKERSAVIPAKRARSSRF
jgi:hypothetical protein